jgi:methyl-accepting chemotaxis protein
MEKDFNAKETLRKQEIIDNIIGSFQKKIVNAFEALSSSCMGLDSISDSMKNTVMVSSEKSVRTVCNADKMNQETQMVASAIVEMSASIQDINRNMMSGNDSFVDAVNKTEAIDKIIQELINETKKITTIVEAIDNISKHVKLLSLNAAIEAERAGEYGKGFAVVATEIKDLACQTEESTKNIYIQVKAIDKASMDVVTFLNPVKTSVNLIKDVFNQIAHAIKEQEMATKEMSRTMDSFATSVKEVSSDVRDVGDSFGDVEGSSEQLNDAVQIISELSTSLDSEVKIFFQIIKEKV